MPECVLSVGSVCVKTPGELHGRPLLVRKKGQDIGLFYVVYHPLSADDTCCLPSAGNSQESPACALTKAISIGSFEMANALLRK